MLAPRESQAEPLTLLASKLFVTTSIQSNGLAFDFLSSTEHLYIADNAAQLRVYTLDGSLVAGPLTLAGGGSTQELGLHFVREATTIGAVALPAGTLTFFRGGSGALNPTVLYAINKATGSATASDVLGTSYNSGSCHPLRNRGTGLGYSTRRDLFLSIDPFCQAIADISGGAVTGHFTSQSILPGQNLGDVKEHPLTGALWVGSPATGSQVMLTEYTQTGTVLREFKVLDAATDDVVFVSRLAFDTSGARLWLLAADGDVYEVAVSSAPSAQLVPALGPWGWAVMIVLLGLSALHFRGTRRRASLMPQPATRRSDGRV
ncbi:MAG: hypothetical protein JRG76_14510 [Deltaproteobacteria bacterium]|nr:hypothetical protein [Deltaproteobacteria bacterium]MBW2415715.1 hypothetical protein [Deltaproteobacteria bacterium]